MKTNLTPKRELSAQIADRIRAAIIDGSLKVDSRLPSEAELAESFGVSRPTVREALKRLAAKNLIRTQRGATGGAFVNRMTYREARDDQVTTSTLLLSMNDVSFEAACEARFALEASCIALACARREGEDLAAMEAELARQADETITDEAFCASDVAFHRAFVDAAKNPVLSYQLAGAVEAMQPLMNLLTYTGRSRARILRRHRRLLTALTARDTAAVHDALDDLAAYTIKIAGEIEAAKAR